MKKILVTAVVFALGAVWNAQGAVIDEEIGKPASKKSAKTEQLLQKIGTSEPTKKTGEQAKKKLELDWLEKKKEKDSKILAKKKQPPVNVAEPAMAGLLLMGITGLGVARRKIRT